MYSYLAKGEPLQKFSGALLNTSTPTAHSGRTIATASPPHSSATTFADFEVAVLSPHSSAASYDGTAGAALSLSPLAATPVPRPFHPSMDAFSHVRLSFQGDERPDNAPEGGSPEPWGPSTDGLSQDPPSFQGEGRYDCEPEGGRFKPPHPSMDVFSHEPLLFQGKEQVSYEPEEERPKPFCPTTEQRRLLSKAVHDALIDLPGSDQSSPEPTTRAAMRALLSLWGDLRSKKH